MLVPVRLIAVAFGRRLMRLTRSVARQQRRLLVGGGGAPVRRACIDVTLSGGMVSGRGAHQRLIGAQLRTLHRCSG